MAKKFKDFLVKQGQAEILYKKAKSGHKPTHDEEKVIAHSTEYSFLYAREVLRGPFKLGEPAIAKSADYSYVYAHDVLRGPFKLGEPAIAKSAEISHFYAKYVLKGPFYLNGKLISNG